MSVDPVSFNPSSSAEEVRDLPENKRDRQTDDQILALLSSSQLENAVFSYSYDHRPWEIRIIHNPERKTMTSEDEKLHLRFPVALIAKEPLPAALENHLIDLIEKKLGTKSVYISSRSSDFDKFAQLKTTDNPSPITFHFPSFKIPTPPTFSPPVIPSLKIPEIPQLKTQIALPKLTPVIVNKDGELDAEFDAQIKECFNSKEIVNRIFHYQIAGVPYRVRIIHNPEKMALTATYKSTTLAWPYKYGILIDKKEAPKELIEHLTKLVDTSWWNWYFSFFVSAASQITWETENLRHTLNMSPFDFYTVLKK